MAVQLSMAQAFSRYDSLGSGGLTSSDIEAFLHAADFDADAAYVAEIMQLWDIDHSGLVEWGEFCELWAHLGLGDTAAFAKDEVAAVFDRFNANGDGMLDMEEVRAMLDAAGYAADSEYVVGLADMFGTYDADGSGGIELSEFREMYEKLGLGPLLAGATGGAAPAVAWPNEVLGGEQRAREVTAVFDRFNTNGDGMLDMKEVILPTAPGVSSEGGSSPLLVPLPAVSWPWVPACGLLEPPRRDGENAQKTGKNGGKMGEIRPKTCKGVGITWDAGWILLIPPMAWLIGRPWSAIVASLFLTSS